MNFSSFIENTFVMLWILITLLIFNGCEPEPKMIGYGSNEYSQLEFPGTNWNHEQLSQGYTGVWVGGNFTIAANYGGLGFPLSGMLCKGDSSLGQCDFPSELPDHFNSPEIHENISLGLNHGMAVVIDSNSVPLTSINQDTNFSTLPSTRLIMWGDNSLNQTTIPDLPDTNHIFQIAAGNNHNIIHIADAELTEIESNFYFTIQNQRLISWGDNAYGQCNIPSRFNPLSDSLTIVRIDAGANHTIVTYDSSGVIKMAAWGDNTYGQSNELSSLDLNGDKTFLDIFCGYNHNVVITYNPNINYYSDIEAGNIVDTLVISSQTTQSNDPWALFPISIHAWGDNSYGQLDIPTLRGHFEAFEAGGFHNTIATTENIFILEPGSYYDYGPPVPGGDLFFSSTGREITGWGKNDFGQSEFPVEYIINWVPSDSTIEGYPAANSPPKISSGENKIEELYIDNKFSTIHMGSSKYFHSDDLFVEIRITNRSMRRTQQLEIYDNVPHEMKLRSGLNYMRVKPRNGEKLKNWKNSNLTGIIALSFHLKLEIRSF